ncbi:MAG: LacI family DNA-binding transcriptional regulator [Acidimicrobiia bacterium]|nr:LacI family DNA-binding transcriptional regulator [Acidimicrobiia bacterium]
MKLTLEDIGRLAGVSRSTVSRVINNQPNVHDDVRANVLEVIERTGYAPNAAARSLVSGRSGVIGLVIPSRVHAIFEDPYFSRLIQGISAASNSSGNMLSLFLFQSAEEETDLYPRVVKAGFLDGLIVTATRMGDPLLASLTGSDLPVVIVGRPDTGGVSYVDVDNHDGGVKAAVHLYELGHRKIGLLGAPVSTTAGLDRLNGFVQGLATCGMALDPKLRVDGDFSESGGYEAMQKLAKQRPDAVFAASDTMAFGALRALQEHGISVPQDMAIVGFDGMPASEKSIPALTTIRQPVAETGTRAVQVLNDLISGAASAPVVEILPVELVVRQSTDSTAPALGGRR